MDVTITMVSDDEAMLNFEEGRYEASITLTLAEVATLARWVADDYPAGLETVLAGVIRLLAGAVSALRYTWPDTYRTPTETSQIRSNPVPVEVYSTIGCEAAAVLSAQRNKVGA